MWEGAREGAGCGDVRSDPASASRLEAAVVGGGCGCGEGLGRSGHPQPPGARLTGEEASLADGHSAVEWTLKLPDSVELYQAAASRVGGFPTESLVCPAVSRGGTDEPGIVWGGANTEQTGLSPGGEVTCPEPNRGSWHPGLQFPPWPPCRQRVRPP